MEHEEFKSHELRDVSHGGIAFTSDHQYEVGDIVELRYPTLSHPETVRGEIVWTAAVNDSQRGTHVNGLRFEDESAHFHGRIVEQLCQIEDYRREQREEHERELTSAEAAAEWIAAFADKFPN